MTPAGTRLLTVAAVAAAFAAGLVLSLSVGRAPPVPSVPDRADVSAAPSVAPGISFEDQWGATHRLADWRGRLVVLNFWATWCPPCVHEIPAFVALQEDYGDERVRFVGVAIDEPSEAHAFAAELGMNYPTMADPVAPLGLMREYGNVTGGLPFTVFISPRGEILHRHAGAITRADAASLIDRFLAKP